LRTEHYFRQRSPWDGVRIEIRERTRKRRRRWTPILIVVICDEALGGGFD
jgi:hypothetical protein